MDKRRRSESAMRHWLGSGWQWLCIFGNSRSSQPSILTQLDCENSSSVFPSWLKVGSTLNCICAYVHFLQLSISLLLPLSIMIANVLRNQMRDNRHDTLGQAYHLINQIATVRGKRSDEEGDGRVGGWRRRCSTSLGELSEIRITTDMNIVHSLRRALIILTPGINRTFILYPFG